MTEPLISQSDANALLLHLKVAPSVIKDFKMAWVAQSGLVDNVAKVIKEYKVSRKLTVRSTTLNVTQ